MEPSFCYTVCWREASMIRQQLTVNMLTVYQMKNSPTGEFQFVFPNLPPRLYSKVCKVFCNNGIPLDNFKS